MHAGAALYRDGDYYGRAVNLAARVAARAAGGEVLVTEPVRAAGGSHLGFDRIGQVTLKGFREPTELFVAARAGVSGGADLLEIPSAPGGLLAPGRPVVVLLSGGRDSVCLLDLAVRIAGPPDVAALHCEYGLRDSAAGDAAHCARAVRAARRRARAAPPRASRAGNLQAWARHERYAAAAELRPTAAPTSPPATPPPTRSRPCSTGCHLRRAVRAARRRARVRARASRGQRAGVGAPGPLRGRAGLAAARGADLAAGHTASDQVETCCTGSRPRPAGARCSGCRRARAV